MLPGLELQQGELICMGKQEAEVERELVVPLERGEVCLEEPRSPAPPGLSPLHPDPKLPCQ